MVSDPLRISPVRIKWTVLSIGAMRPLTIVALFRRIWRCDAMMAFVMLTCAGGTPWSEGAADGSRVSPPLTHRASLDSGAKVGCSTGWGEASCGAEINRFVEKSLEV